MNEETPNLSLFTIKMNTHDITTITKMITLTQQKHNNYNSQDNQLVIVTSAHDAQTWSVSSQSQRHCSTYLPVDGRGGGEGVGGGAGVGGGEGGWWR